MTRYLDPDDASALREIAKANGAALKEAHENAREAAKAVAVIFEQSPQTHKLYKSPSTNLAPHGARSTMP